MVRKLWGSGAPGASPPFSHNLVAAQKHPRAEESPGGSPWIEGPFEEMDRDFSHPHSGPG